MGACAIRFSGPDEKDLSGEYFTEATDFGPRNGDGAATLFHHGNPVGIYGFRYVLVPGFPDATLAKIQSIPFWSPNASITR